MTALAPSRQSEHPSPFPKAKVDKLRDQGYCIIPGVLTPDATANVRERLVWAAEESERRGVPTHLAIDPNDRNVRVFHLLELDEVFRDLIVHPLALQLVNGLLGEDVLISNFTANIALPGSRSMKVHSDQSIVIPEPWCEPWSMNIIWCLDDVHAANGATLFLPGSHRIERAAQVGEDPVGRMIPFEAQAGSIIAMDGRMWHTSGANVTTDVERALLFGYYSRAFIRPQMNWNAALSSMTQASVSPQLRALLGLNHTANVGLGARLSFDTYAQ